MPLGVGISRLAFGAQPNTSAIIQSIQAEGNLDKNHFVFANVSMHIPSSCQIVTATHNAKKFIMKYWYSVKHLSHSSSIFIFEQDDDIGIFERTFHNIQDPGQQLS